MKYITPLEACAVEFGYKACEKGKNLLAATIDYSNIAGKTLEEMPPKFQVTNSTYKMVDKIRNIKAGKIFFHANHAFVKLATPFESGMKCSNCGDSTFNAHNFGNAVHFCVDRPYEFTLTEFSI